MSQFSWVKYHTNIFYFFAFISFFVACFYFEAENHEFLRNFVQKDFQTAVLGFLWIIIALLCYIAAVITRLRLLDKE